MPHWITLLGGNALLAMHMGTDEDMATQIGEPITLTVCEKCAIEKEYPVAAMAEMGTDKEEE